MEAQKFIFDQQKEIIRQQESNRDYELKYQDHLLKLKKDRREEEADARERDKNRAIVKDGALNTDVEVPDVSSLTQDLIETLQCFIVKVFYHTYLIHITK